MFTTRSSELTQTNTANTAAVGQKRPYAVVRCVDLAPMPKFEVEI